MLWTDSGHYSVTRLAPQLGEGAVPFCCKELQQCELSSGVERGKVLVVGGGEAALPLEELEQAVSPWEPTLGQGPAGLVILQAGAAWF